MPANVANAVNQIYKIIEEATAEWDTADGGAVDGRRYIKSAWCVRRGVACVALSMKLRVAGYVNGQGRWRCFGRPPMPATSGAACGRRVPEPCLYRCYCATASTHI